MAQAVCATCGGRFDYGVGAAAGAHCPSCGIGSPRSIEPARGRPVRVMPSTPERPRTSRLAVASFALALAGLLIPFLGLAAWLLGRAAIKRIDDPIYRERGHELAAAGVSVGKVSVWIWLVLTLLLSVAVPTLQLVRAKAQQMQNGTQLRGLHQGHILYSQGNNAYYAGLTALGGQPPDISPGSGAYYAAGANYVSIGLAQLFNGNYMTPQYVIAPNEPNPSFQQAYTETHHNTGSRVTPNNYSFASLQISQLPTDATRRSEWRNNNNPQAVILADRVLDRGQEAGGPVPAGNQSSIWSGWWHPGWRGNVVFGDNSEMFLESSSIPLTRYGRSSNAGDNLFVLDDGTLPGADASLVRN